ncbi:MAG: SCO family protein [Chloroflexota bacterium]
MKRIFWTILGMTIGLGLVLIAWYVTQRNYAYQGVVIDPPAPAADFELADQHGQPFHLRGQQGKIVLIFFGYTNCPDVCPVTLSEYKQIKAQLGEQAENVRFVFITVDPERDSPERLAAYLANFDSTFIGLSGTRAQLEPIWRSYGVYQEKRDVGSASGYLVDHTAITFLIDAQSNWHINYPFGMETEKIVADLQHLIKE